MEQNDTGSRKGIETVGDLIQVLGEYDPTLPIGISRPFGGELRPIRVGWQRQGGASEDCPIRHIFVREMDPELSLGGEQR